MSSVLFERVRSAFDALAAHADGPSECWSSSQRREQLQRIETLARMLPALGHELINQLGADASAEELGGSLSHALANWLHISRSEATRRIHEAADLGPRRALTGEELPPKLAATAAAQHRGDIGAEHVQVIRGFFSQLPCWIDEPTRADAEHHLADVAAGYRPDELRRFAAHLDLVVNPDGNFTDTDRARRRGITLGPQGPDGMSRIIGWLNPELRAGLDAVLAKWAAPGMCNPDNHTPTVDTAPDTQTINTDTRTTAQRHHDALNAMVRSILMSGELGTHHGLPVTIVATVDLADLHNKTGMAHTGGGTLLPTTDLIRMAAHAHNYLLVFDNAKKCELYRGRDTRLATPAQRLVLYATERGCTHPGCDIPAYWCQVHHAEKDWAAGGQTNIDEETLACPPHNRLVDEHGWTTRKRKDGTTEWIPPPNLDRGQRRTNLYFHPEKMPREDDEPGS
jgi:Domain of unknown function (DUF222)